MKDEVKGERNEKEHKELIVTANNGLKAIGVLRDKYSDMTEAVDGDDGEKFDLDRDVAFLPNDVIQEKE